MYYSQNNSIIAQNTTFGYNYGYNCSCHVRPSDFIMPSACISSRSLRTRRLFWSSVLPVGSASLRNLKIASNFMPSSPAFLTTCCAIIFNLSRSRPLSLVYSDTCFVFLAMSSEIVYKPLLFSISPRDRSCCKSSSCRVLPFWTASSNRQSSKERSLFSFNSFVYFSLMALPYRRTATSFLAASIS